MQRDEIRATGRIAANFVGGFGLLARDVHLAVAARVFGALGPIASPIRSARRRHQGRPRGRARRRARAPASGARGARPARPRRRAGLGSSVRGGLALAAINGYAGDALAAEGSPLALELGDPAQGARRRPDRAWLRPPSRTPPAGSPSSSTAWSRPRTPWRLPPIGRGSGVRRTYGERLSDELGYTSLTLRYKHRPSHLRQRPRAGGAAGGDGRRVAGAGRGDHLVGHSMGGLVGAARATGASSTTTPGSAGPPCLHARLAAPGRRSRKGRQRGGLGVRRSRRPRRWPRVNGRSVGIKDLRFGSLAEADWMGHDPDEYLRDRCQEVPFLPDAAYYFIGASAPGPVRAGPRRPARAPSERVGSRARGGVARSRSKSTMGDISRPDPLRSAQPSRGLRPAEGMADAGSRSLPSPVR